jgi:hypothetical protein
MKKNHPGANEKRRHRQPTVAARRSRSFMLRIDVRTLLFFDQNVNSTASPGQARQRRFQPLSDCHPHGSD